MQYPLRVILVLMLSAGAASAQVEASPSVSRAGIEVDQRSSRTGLLTTHAQARRRIENSVSDVTAGIVVQAADRAAVSAILSQRSAALLAYLRELSVERLRTDQLAVEPQFRPEPSPSAGRVRGYIGRTTVSFRTVPARLGELLDGALAHGASSVDQSGSSPREAEIEAVRNELAAEASRTAMTQATAVAAAINYRVVGVERLDVGLQYGGGPRPMMVQEQAASARIGGNPAEAGETELVADVSLVVRITPPE